MNICKPQKELSGILQAPVTVGIPAYIADSDGCIRTSTVMGIRSQTETQIVFETRNTVYTLHFENAYGGVRVGKAVADA